MQRNAFLANVFGHCIIMNLQPCFLTHKLYKNTPITSIKIMLQKTQSSSDMSTYSFFNNVKNKPKNSHNTSKQTLLLSLLSSRPAVLLTELVKQFEDAVSSTDVTSMETCRF